MESHLHLELQKLKVSMMEMFALTERALDTSIRALLERDDELAQHVIDGDADINNMETRIEETILNLMALWQPVAKDLRFLAGCSKVINEIERIGDQSTNIAERAIMLNRKPKLGFMNSVQSLADVSLDMYRKSMQAFSELDCQLASTVCSLDSKADDMNVTIIKRLIDYMTTESVIVERAVHSIIVANSLERVSDLATNISEYVFFIVQGINVRHSHQFDARCSNVTDNNKK